MAQTRLDRLNVRIGTNEQSRLRMSKLMRLQPAITRLAGTFDAVTPNDFPALLKSTEAVFRRKQPKRP